MTAKEQELITALKGLKDYGYGGYHFIEELNYTIAKVMGYEIVICGRNRVYPDIMKIAKIREGLTKHNIIKWSKNRDCWKLIKNN